MARLGREKRMLAYSEAEQQDIIERATEREMTRSVIESKGSERHSDKETTNKIPVVMRLGETPVLIPNTKVKT